MIYQTMKRISLLSHLFADDYSTCVGLLRHGDEAVCEVDLVALVLWVGRGLGVVHLCGASRLEDTVGPEGE